MPPDLQPRSFRPYNIQPSVSAPTFSSFDGERRISNNNNTLSHRSSRSLANSNTSGSSRFSPSSFAHNARIAIALVPCAAFLLDLGGTPVIATLTIGLMVAYILDSLNFKPGSFFAVWLSLLAAQIAFFFSSYLFVTFNSLPLGFLAAFLCAETNFLIGVWASLQFKWIQIENPSIVVALERLLFASVPIVASAIFTWATISAVGMANASYYLIAFSCLFYWLYSIPRISSFKSKSESGYHGGEVPDEILILTQLEGCLHTLSLLFLPLLFHVASHHSVMFSSAAAVSDLFLLFFIPFLFQLYSSTRGSLSWLTKDPLQLHSIRIMNGAVALVVVVICLEIRIVFHAFGRYIQVPPPWNYLLVTTTMLGGASATGAYALGMISDSSSSGAFSAAAVIVSAAGAIVVGFPFMV